MKLETYRGLNWMLLMPFHPGRNGQAHLLAYDPGNGRARKVRLRDNLTGFRVIYASDSWLRGYR